MHKQIRAEYDLLAEPPKSEGWIRCDLCSNECKTKEMRICWEWNGCGNRNFVNPAAEILRKSSVIVKFNF